MKVLTLCTRFSVGGAQLNSLLLASELEARGYSVNSCFLFEQEKFYPKAQVNIVKFVESKQSRFKLGKAILNYYLFCKKSKPDVVVCFHPMANIVASLFSRILGYKIIATQRNPSSSMSVVTRVLDKILGCFLYNENICVSQSVKNSFSDYPLFYQNRLSVIYNGLSNLNISNISRDVSIPIKIGFIGRLDEQKNPVRIIELAVLARNNYPGEFSFVIAGDGPLKQSLFDMVSFYKLDAMVKFIGQLNFDQLPEFYSSIDIFLMPSRYEGFGRSLLENMMFGNIMILSDIDVFHEIAGDCAFYAEDDVSSYLNALALAKDVLLNDNYMLFKDKITARSRCFSIESMIDSYEKKILVK